MKNPVRNSRAPIVLAFLLTTFLLTAPLLGLSGETAANANATAPGPRIETTKATDGSKIASMTVETDVPKTEVYLDGIYEGLTPLTLDDVRPGIRLLALKKDGFWASQYTIEIKPGETKDIYAELVRASGFLSVHDAPENAEILVDEKIVSGTLIELGEGIHSVTIRAFGYTERREDVRIVRKEETTLSLILDPAPFSIRDFKLQRSAFNPENPESIGTASVSFTVSAPGKITLRILDSAQREVRLIDSKPFDTWKQALKWDGRDSAGTALPDGEYSLELAAVKAGSTGSEPAGTGTASEIVYQTTVRLDRTIAYPWAAPVHGIGSHGPVASGTLMPKGTLIVLADTVFASNVFNPALSALAGVSDWLEAGVRVGIRAGEGNESGVTVAGGAKAGLPGGLAGGVISPAVHLRFETGEGIAAGCDVDLRKGRLSAGISAECLYGDSDGYFDDPFFSAGAGLALRYAIGNLSLTAWEQSNTAHSPENFGTPLEHGVGLSAQFLVPDTSLIVLGEAGWTFIPSGDDILHTRLGIGFSL